MDCGAVERMVAVVDAQEASRLLECLRAEAADVEKLPTGFEDADGAAMVDDVIRQAL